MSSLDHSPAPGTFPVNVPIPSTRESVGTISTPDEGTCDPPSAGPSDAAVGLETGTPPPISVLHVVNGEHFSGAERVQSHLGRCLPLFGVTADFACVCPGRFAERLEAGDGRHGRCERLPMKHRLDLATAWRLAQLVRRRGDAVMHAHTPRTAMLTSIASTLTGVPWIYHVHSPAARDSARGLTNRINAIIERRSLAACSAIVTVSESLRADCLTLGHHPDRVQVVHNGVPAIAPPRKPDPELNGPWVMGIVALMRPRKGIEVLLEALAQLRPNFPNLILRCIGEFESEEYRRSIESLADRLGVTSAIEWTGFVDDVPAALARLDAMILPSLYGEGLPMVVLEAMAAGTPVIATRVEGTPEAVTDGVEGLLAEANDPRSLASRMQQLVRGEHDWKAISKAAQRRHADAFSDHAMARGIAAVYRDVLARI